MKLEDIIFEKSNGVATITLNRPDRRNALGSNTTFEILDAAQDAVNDPQVRIIVFTGAGESFCAGGDHRDIFKPGFEKTALEWRHRIRIGVNKFVMILNQSEKPTIAAINGIAVGGGCTIALACDIRIASEKAKLGLVFSRIGATPEFGCTYFLPRLVGIGKSLELLLTADIIDAREAERIGLINKVVPHEKLKGATQEFVDKLLEKPQPALGMTKSLIYRSLSSDIVTQLELEAFAISTAFKTEEHKEAVKAFLDKRNPRFLK